MAPGLPRKGESVSKSTPILKLRAAASSRSAARFGSVWLVSPPGPYHATRNASMPAACACSMWRPMALRSRLT